MEGLGSSLSSNWSPLSPGSDACVLIAAEEQEVRRGWGVGGEAVAIGSSVPEERGWASFMVSEYVVGTRWVVESIDACHGSDLGDRSLETLPAAGASISYRHGACTCDLRLACSGSARRARV